MWAPVILSIEDWSLVCRMRDPALVLEKIAFWVPNGLMIVLISTFSWTYSGPREQANMVSSFMDASMIYGSAAQEAKDLRTFQDGTKMSFGLFTSKISSFLSNNFLGKLKTTVVPLVKDLLPQAEYNPEECRSTRNQLCFKSGNVKRTQLLFVLWHSGLSWRFRSYQFDTNTDFASYNLDATT